MGDRVIPIVGDNGWPECQDCQFQDSDTCDFCEDADQFEPIDMLEAA